MSSQPAGAPQEWEFARPASSVNAADTDPHSFTDEPRSTNTQTCINITCSVVGAGILALPKGLGSAGWSGLPLLAVVCPLSIYSGIVIVKCINYTERASGDLSSGLMAAAAAAADAGGGGSGSGSRNSATHRPSSSLSRRLSSHASRAGSKAVGLSFAEHVAQALCTYGDVGEAAFGRTGRSAVNVCAHLSLIGPCIGYLVLGGSNLSLLVCNALSVPAAIALATGVMLPHVFLPTLTETAVLSAVNVAVALWLIVAVVYEAIAEDQTTGFTPGSCTADAFAPGGGGLRTTFINLGLGWWYAFPAFANPFACHAVLPSIYEEMRDKKSYNKVLTGTFLVICALYAVVGVVGYAEFAQCTQAPIYWNLKAGFGRLSAIVLITIHVLLTFCVFCFVSEVAFGGALLDAIEARRGAELGPGAARAVMVSGKALLVLFCMALAIVIPDFEGVFGLVGSLPVSFTSFVLPGAFHLKLYGGQLTTRRKLVDVGMIAFGLLGAVFGSIASVIGMIDTFKNGEEKLRYPDYCPSSTDGGWNF